MRLFVAIDLPDAVKDQLDGLCAGVSGAKWVKREQMHLTLRFIGEVDAHQFKTIQSALGDIRCTPFEIALKGVGQFPPKGRPRVLWAGITAPRTLQQLVGSVEAALRETGIPPEERPFSPHITLARLKTPPPQEAVSQYFRRHGGFQTAGIPVTQFVLMSSVLARTGATYTVEG
ncbi:MAG: RNA 2',3'-cyclic phosphodiesterase, partial [Anaerolineaceae bacterium]|nr:RNA 2',3'-cyclic phosphodiesterase [Anaerolineaceae bacterium]